MGNVSKVILIDMCENALNINQWSKKNDCIKWFKNYNKNDSVP